MKTEKLKYAFSPRCLLILSIVRERISIDSGSSIILIREGGARGIQPPSHKFQYIDSIELFLFDFVCVVALRIALVCRWL